MFDDRRVLEAVPPAGFIREVFDYACAKNPAIPLIYQLGCAYALTSSLVTNDPRIAVPDHDRPTGLWILVVGASGVGKSSAINLVRGLYDEIVGEPPWTIPGTTEGLYRTAMQHEVVDPEDPDNQRSYAVLRFWDDDLGKMLSSSSRSQSFAGTLRAALLGFFDGQSRQEALATKVYRCPRNRTSVVGGVTPAQITKDTDPLEWETGFFSRFIMMYHAAPMKPCLPKYDDTTLDEMRQKLVRVGKRLFAGHAYPGANGERYPWRLSSMLRQSDAFKTRGARDLYTYHREALRKREVAASRFAKGPIQRAADQALRVAAMYTLAEAKDVLGEPGSWRFSEEAIEAGFRFAWLHVLSAESLASMVTASPFAKLCAAIVEVLDHAPRPCTVGDIHFLLAKTEGRYQPRRVDEALVALTRENRVFTSDDDSTGYLDNSGGGRLYSLDPFPSS